MPAAMGRRRSKDLDLPPHVYRRVRGGRERFYYGKAGIALGSTFAEMLRRYAEIHTGAPTTGTFAEAAVLFQREALAGKAPKTQREYARQLPTLVKVFGHMRLDAIAPGDVADFLRERAKVQVDAKGRRRGGPIVATREKALLSAVFTHARERHLTSAPNPCAGIRGTKSKRARYVTDAELAAAIAKATLADDAPLAAFLELTYRTGQRPSDVLRMTRADVQDGALLVDQGKTGARVRIALVGPLRALLSRLTTGSVSSLRLIHDEAGQPITLQALRKRFLKLGVGWQLRDLRAKAATDSSDAKAAQSLLGHAAASTTDGYIRQHAGGRAQPITRKIKGLG